MAHHLGRELIEPQPLGVGGQNIPLVRQAIVLGQGFERPTDRLLVKRSRHRQRVGVDLGDISQAHGCDDVIELDAVVGYEDRASPVDLVQLGPDGPLTEDALGRPVVDLDRSGLKLELISEDVLKRCELTERIGAVPVSLIINRDDHAACSSSKFGITHSRTYASTCLSEVR